jgi:hypothetical protein
MRRFACGALLGAGLVGLAGCTADPFGAPARVKTHGYRAHVTVRQDERVTAEYEIAVRGADRRLSTAEGSGPELLVRGAERRAFRIDPNAKTAAVVPWESAEKELLAGYPLGAGFDDRAEADRRGIKHYRRDGDEVFSGHACALWRYEDRPGEDDSPTTTYWVAPDLDGLVVRVDRKTPRAEGGKSETVTQLTNVRVGADPSLFAVPK